MSEAAAHRGGELFEHDSSAGSGSAGKSLPQELRERAGIRLRLAAGAYAGAASLSVLSEVLMSRGERPATWVWTPAQVADAIVFGSASVVVSLAFIALMSFKRFAPSVERTLGHVYWVATALGIGLATSYEVHGHLGWVGVWIVALPLVLPARPTHTLVVSLICASAIPAAYFIHLARGLVEPAAASSLASFFLPNFVCAALAYGIAATIYRLGRAVERQRQLGAYKLVERIGAGGMGEVWRAEHRTLVRPAAIKLVRHEQLAEGGSTAAAENALRRFEREAQATALLSSPHTIEVFDFGVTGDGTFYIVMELLDGMDLHHLLHLAGGALPPERAVYLLRQVAHSLSDAHHAGLLHRDIKPPNVFVCRKGLDLDYVKVLDFGLAKHTVPEKGEAQLTVEGAIAGTPGYMSPEAATGAALDARTDIYSFGCLAYRVLAGRDVFEGATPLQQLVLHMTTDPEPLTDAASQPIPPALAALVMRCIAKNVDERPSSMQDIGRELEEMGLQELWSRERAEAFWSVIRPVAVQELASAPTALAPTQQPMALPE